MLFYVFGLIALLVVTWWLGDRHLTWNLVERAEYDTHVVQKWRNGFGRVRELRAWRSKITGTHHVWCNTETAQVDMALGEFCTAVERRVRWSKEDDDAQR